MPQLDAAALVDPAWIAHRYDLPRDVFVLRHFARDRHAAIPFLTDEYIGDAPAEPDWAGRSEVMAQVPRAPVHFLFHSAFCNSTLLVRALAQPGLAMGLSEPVVLNDLVGLRRRGEIDGAGLGERVDAALTLLARPWGAGECVVVKPSNIVNPIAPGLLAMRPDAKAVVMHTALPLFLASVARKGLWARLWVRELAEGFLRDGAFAPLGLGPEDVLRLTDLQVAAAGWLAQQGLFHAMARQFGEGRVRGLDAERLYPDPAALLTRVADHFGFARDPAARARLADADALRRHSKTGAAFDMAARRAEQDEALRTHRDEIDAVVTWAQACARAAGIAMDIPSPL